MKVIFKQKNKKAAQAKMRRLVNNPKNGTIGFCNFQLVKDFSDYISYKEIENNPFIIDYYIENNMYEWAIQAYSTYHAESTIRRMYKTNGKEC